MLRSLCTPRKHLVLVAGNTLSRWTSLFKLFSASTSLELAIYAVYAAYALAGLYLASRFQHSHQGFKMVTVTLLQYM
jgi:hypothetical protein